MFYYKGYRNMTSYSSILYSPKLTTNEKLPSEKKNRKRDFDIAILPNNRLNNSKIFLRNPPKNYTGRYNKNKINLFI